MWESIRDDIIAALLTTIVVGLIGYLLGLFQIDQLSDVIVPAFVALVLFVVLLLLSRYFSSPIRRRFVVWLVNAELKHSSLTHRGQSFKEALIHLIGTPNGAGLTTASGLVGWHVNFQECRARLESLLSRAASVKLLTYISELHKGTVFYDGIAKNPNPNVEIKILICSVDSPFVSAEYAREIGHDKKQAAVWKRRILEGQEDIRHLREHHDKLRLEVRSHDLPFVWDLWFIDDVLFVTAKLYYKGNRNRGLPIYEIQRSVDQMRLFEMFERYFDREWQRAKEIMAK